MLERILEEEVIITLNGRRRTVTKLQAAIIQLTDKATGGDLKALQLLTSLLRSAEERGSQGVVPNSVSDDLDKKVVSGILSRISAFNKEDSENANERRAGEALHPEREPLEILNHIRKALGEYNFAGQYLQSPAPLGGGLVKAEWFKTYTATPEKFEMILQSWDSANKASELSDFSVCTTWGVKERHIYLLHVFRKRLDYPDLKRAVEEQAEVFGPQTILIEDKASGTQLIQKLVAEGMHAIQKYEPSMNKVIRMNTVTSMIECGFVHMPDKGVYLAEYLHELANFPNGKHDDQADSTSQALDWFKHRYVILKDPFIIAFKDEHWTKLPGEFPGSGSDSPYPSAFFRGSGRTRIPSFGRS
jgi:predicted phage terminase large subunit-like protein